MRRVVRTAAPLHVRSRSEKTLRSRGSVVKVRFEHVWTPDGWVHDRVLRVTDGTIASVSPPHEQERAKSQPGYLLPGLTSLHSHAFQRGMAGLAERRGTGDESFWTWREVMYGFLDRLTPDDVRDIAAMAYVEMVERGFTSVVEFHYLHHDIDGRPYANRAAMAEAIVEAAREAGIGLTLLPTLYRFGGFGGAAPGHGSGALSTRPTISRPLVNASTHAIAAHDGRPPRPGAAFAARGRAGRHRARHAHADRGRRSTSTPPSRRRRSPIASPGAASGRCAGCSTRSGSTRAGA